jgi:hypothetical protein
MNIEALREYLKIHLISLTQDLDKLDPADEQYSYVLAQIEGYIHILEVMNEQ